MKKLISLLLLYSIVQSSHAQNNQIDNIIFKIIDEVHEQHRDLYIDLHRNPELSLMEFETARKMAENMQRLGFEVTEGIGGNGVVGILRNGEGRSVMLRTDMDALPVRETTGLPFASKAVTGDLSGIEVPVMHACGHDLHMSVWLGTLTTLVNLKESWRGTLIAVAQPAEEIGAGALGMISDGLFKRFPVPDYALSYHVSAEMQAGTIGYFPGPIFAGVRSVDMTVYGSGGHGAMPHTTVDPIVMAARIILDLQTIVSREINPVKPAVITVGSIHGGTKHNIIPDEVEMLLTIRFFEEKIYEHIVEAISRISRGIAISAGLPENKMPLVRMADQYTPPVNNNPELVMNTVASMQEILGSAKVIQVDPATVGEDFGQYGRTEENIPVALFWLGGVNHELYESHLTRGTFLPPLHNPSFAPDFGPAFRGGVAAMSRAVIDLFGNEQVINQ